ncbi:type II secretion system protein M [Vibrio sp. SCSIO 43135]|uniref:type II secretion system protein M n=1 Tax=Vibrio sp. SCSIO 43135 TaxID=2819096 RepID=UPI00207587C6|nr:type II secretion system protein M [Vibrio sp. SCSIO 43135]USD41226.1 type II secretion system protein M [Vibrio sp. SCSIO 43135]
MDKMLATFNAWWGSISQREQRLVMVCTALLVVGGIYWGVIQPLTERAEQAQMRINSEKQLLNWVSNTADEITSLRAQSGIKTSSQPMNQVISSSARRFNIELIRVQPRDEMIQVWIQPVVFNQFVNWLDYLQQEQGVGVEFLDIDRSERAGVVEVKRLQFKRGS